MKEDYDARTYYDFGKGEGSYNVYEGKDIHPEKTRRGNSRLQSMLTSLKGRDAREFCDEEGFERLEEKTKQEKNIAKL